MAKRARVVGATILLAIAAVIPSLCSAATSTDIAADLQAISGGFVCPEKLATEDERKNAMANRERASSADRAGETSNTGAGRARARRGHSSVRKV